MLCVGEPVRSGGSTSCAIQASSGSNKPESASFLRETRLLYSPRIIRALLVFFSMLSIRDMAGYGNVIGELAIMALSAQAAGISQTSKETAEGRVLRLNQ